MIDLALVDPLGRGGSGAEARTAREAVVEASLRIAAAV
jgi:hypothetical protein